MPEQTYYEILQVAPAADVQTIKRAYRQLIRQHHPDKLAADLSRLQQNGDKAALRAAQQRYEAAKQQTQRINAAYSVLVDTTRREAYDRRLSDERMVAYTAEMRRQRSRNPEYERRTVKSRPHCSPVAKQGQIGTFPLILFVALLVFSVLVFSALTRALTGWFMPETVFVPSAPTAEGVITSHDLQATHIARNATYIARTQTADRPSATPLSAAAYERSADRLFALAAFTDAAAIYGQAIAQNPHEPNLYYKRGLAHLKLFEGGNLQAGAAAVADFSQTISLDATLAQAYRERGLLYFALWQQSGSTALAQSAQADLEEYQSLASSEDAAVHAALEQLRSSVEN